MSRINTDYDLFHSVKVKALFHNDLVKVSLITLPIKTSTVNIQYEKLPLSIHTISVCMCCIISPDLSNDEFHHSSELDKISLRGTSYSYSSGAIHKTAVPTYVACCCEQHFINRVIKCLPKIQGCCHNCASKRKLLFSLLVLCALVRLRIMYPAPVKLKGFTSLFYTHVHLSLIHI